MIQNRRIRNFENRTEKILKNIHEGTNKGDLRRDDLLDLRSNLVSMVFGLRFDRERKVKGSAYLILTRIDGLVSDLSGPLEMNFYDKIFSCVESKIKEYNRRLKLQDNNLTLTPLSYGIEKKIVFERDAAYILKDIQDQTSKGYFTRDDLLFLRFNLELMVNGSRLNREKEIKKSVFLTLSKIDNLVSRSLDYSEMGVCEGIFSNVESIIHEYNQRLGLQEDSLEATHT